MTIAVLAASVVGSVAGGLAALHSPWGSSAAGSTPAPPAAPAVTQPAPAVTQPAPAVTQPAPTVAQPAPAVAGSAVVQAPTPVPAPPPPPDPRAAVATQMKTVLGRFATWARDHAGAPCPERAAFGIAPDPWGHPLALTCTDQPADQRVGAISAGPDGIAGNDDDVASWNLGREVTDLVRGPRWKATRSATQAPTARRSKEVTATPDPPRATSTTRPAASTAPPASSTTKPSAAPLDAGADDIPARR